MSGTVLLVMDFQRDIVERGAGPEVVGAAARAVELARDHELRVIYVRVAFRPGYPEVAATNRSFAAIAGGARDLTQDAPGTALHEGLRPRADEPVVLKRRVSAFTGSDLEVILRAEGAESLVLAGISTSGVVLSTLRQAADLDYRLTVLSDACADGDPDVHRVLTEKVFPRQADVLTVEDWARALDAPAS